MTRPRAVSVKAMRDYHILVFFNNGEKRIFDVHPYLSDPFFKKISDPAVFQMVRTNDMSVEWPFGIDICPDELYNNSLEYKE